MEGDLNTKVLTDLGEVKGLLRGVTEMIRNSQESTNRRIDDLSLSINKSMDNLDARIREVGDKADTAMNLSTDTAARISRHSAWFGGGSGALVAGAVEIIKTLLSHR